MDGQVPLWLAVAVAVGTPALAFTGSVIGQLLSRTGAREISELLQHVDRALIAAVCEAVVDPITEGYDEHDELEEQ